MSLRRFVAAHAGWLVAAVTVAVVVTGLVVVPPDASQGDVQRLMYVHVPSAWVGYLAFFVVFVSSAGYLWRRDPRLDRLAAASAEVGVLFTGLAIASGSIWGKATWGMWWDWDPRLTTTGIMLLAYVAYVLLRQSISDRQRRGRIAAAFGVLAFLNVPIVHFSVLWWRGLHQAPTVIRPGDPSIDHVLLAQLVASVVAFSLVFAWLVRERVRLEALRDWEAARV
ncbi:MAG: cytochrome c biogenesis protein CcsA [Candidatus Limnocylindrales bacterium]